jgi:hypothetical protein
MKSVFDLVQQDFKEKGLVEVPCMLERLMASAGCHLFNLKNLMSRRFFHANSLENFRKHVIMMAPSGFSKSTVYRTFLNERDGLFSGAIKTTMEHSFSPESWMGTIESDGRGGKVLSHGLFHEHKQSIVGCDEFQRLAHIMNRGEGETHEESYLMTALDTDRVKKRLSYGNISVENIGMTLWAGMRPFKLDLASGFARRFSFQLFFPTMSIAEEFKKASRSKSMAKTTTDRFRDELAFAVDELNHRLEEINDIDYTAVERWCDTYPNIPHFEEKIYKHISLGYAVSKGQLSSSCVRIEMDSGLDKLLRNEHDAREIIRQDPELQMLYEVIRDAGRIHKTLLMNFATSHYQLPKVKVERILDFLRLQGRIKADGANHLTIAEAESSYKIVVQKT